MNVYIEYVILDNLVIDCLILFAACKTLKLTFKWWRVAIGGFLGAAGAVASVFVNGLWLYVIKGATLIVMCVVTIGVGKKLFWHILLTVAYTFVLGGAIVGLFNLFNIDYVQDGSFYQLNVPLFVYVIAIALAVFLCYSIVTYVKNLRRLVPYLTKVRIALGEKNYNITGFCDSGNTLTHQGLPVCFVTRSFDGFADYYASQMLKGNVEHIDVMTVGGLTSVSAVKAVILGNESRQIYLAIPASKCKTQYNVLLSCDFANL